LLCIVENQPLRVIFVLYITICVEEFLFLSEYAKKSFCLPFFWLKLNAFFVFRLLTKIYGCCIILKCIIMDMCAKRPIFSGNQLHFSLKNVSLTTISGNKLRSDKADGEC